MRSDYEYLFARNVCVRKTFVEFKISRIKRRLIAMKRLSAFWLCDPVASSEQVNIQYIL